MEFPSGRGSPPPAGEVRLPMSCDRISALSDEMILLVLSRLGSVPAAVRTGLLSRRWRDLWTRLTDLAFCNDRADKIEAALASFSDSPAITSVHVRFPVTNDPVSLLHAAARLSPAELVLVIKEEYRQRYSATNVVLPCFRRATRIEVDAGLLGISPPVDGEFAALERLSLAGHILDLGTLLRRCPRLRVLGVTFRAFPDLGSLEAALGELEAAGAGLVLSFLGVDTRTLIHGVDAARLGPLLRAMAMLSPQKVVVTDDFGRCTDANLPCFHHTTSIDMNLRSVCFATVSDGEFSMLERFSMSRSCSIVDLDALVSRCPRLRVLKVTVATGNITVRSASLQDLEVHSNMECHQIDIDAPMVTRMKLAVEAGTGKELSVSISTPLVKKISWKHWYTTSALMFGFWRLECARLESAQDVDLCSQLPLVHSLCLQISPLARV